MLERVLSSASHRSFLRNTNSLACFLPRQPVHPCLTHPTIHPILTEHDVSEL
jgi:hypothetical protein